MFLEKDDIIKNILNVKETTYLVHNFHPYAAKFIPQLPRYLIEKFTKPSEVVLDPFCGSGTTIVEAILLGRNGIGVELNYIGVLVSKVKTTYLNNEQLFNIIQFLRQIKLARLENKTQDLTGIITFPNKFHWFKKDVLNAALYIKSKIDTIEDEAIRNFLLVALSSIIVKISNQESETRYAAVNKEIEAMDVFRLFENKVENMVDRMKKFLPSISREVKAQIFQGDSRYINFLPKNSVDFIVTSPPYPNTYDYYLYHKLRMIVLGFDYKRVQDGEIGSRDKHSSKKEDINTYITSMRECFQNFTDILKPKHYFAIVMGDSVIRNVKYNGYDIIKKITVNTNFKIMQHISYELDNVSRLFNKSFRVKGKKEHIILLQNNKEDNNEN